MENHKDDILKKFLQDTFSDYEPEPSDASWETIFSAIQPNQPTFWGKSKPWIASVLVILTGAWLWYGSANVEANNGEIVLVSGRVETLAMDARVETLAMNKKTNVGRVLSLDNVNVIPQTLPLLVFSPIKAEMNAGRVQNPASVSINSQILLSEEMGLLAKDDKIETQTIKYHKEIVVKSYTPNEGAENHPIVERQSDEVVISGDNLTASTSERVETVATDMSGRVETLATDKEGKQNNTIIEQVRYVRPLESLRNKDFTFAKIALNSLVIAPVITPNREAKPVRQHTYLSMSITPIQTYRILTINNHSVQNVQINNLFDSERNGWQFDLGVTKLIAKLWNFRANLSYLRMRQWSEYQIGTDELILRNSNYGSSNSYPTQASSPELEVVGQTVTESKNLHMVGLKMDVQKFFKITPKNRYFISTGTQVMYENTQKQSNVFLNISAGFQHIVSKTTFLTIEPTASYGLNNFNDSRSLLQTNGYNLGLKMGVSFQVK